MEENYFAAARNGHEMKDMYNPETNTLDMRSNGHYPSNVLSKTRGFAKLFCRHAAWNFLPTCVITVQNQYLLATDFVGEFYVRFFVRITGDDFELDTFDYIYK